MPVARIYASLVEEAEPICADLLARGYHVEVVFPDAILPSPADLELRVERCSAEQAIARVEAAGSSSRCMFVTPAKGPHRELLLVEMTVLATGTEGRHPIAMPQMTLVREHLTNAPVAARTAESGLAEVLPFPVVPLDAAKETAETDEATQPGGAGLEAELTGSQSAKTDQLPKGRDRDPNHSKHLMAELNAFLAHAPIVERPDGLHLRIFENVRQSVGVERARKNWEGLSLAGIAASLVLLTALGWYAAPERPLAASARPPVSAVVPTTAPIVSQVPPHSSASVIQADQGPAALESVVAVATPAAGSLQRASQRRRLASPRRHKVRVQDDLVAVDSLSRIGRASSRPSARELLAPKAPTSGSIAGTTSELVRPAAMRTAPIKIISDLK